MQESTLRKEQHIYFVINTYPCLLCTKHFSRCSWCITVFVLPAILYVVRLACIVHKRFLTPKTTCRKRKIWDFGSVHCIHTISFNIYNKSHLCSILLFWVITLWGYYSSCYYVLYVKKHIWVILTRYNSKKMTDKSNVILSDTESSKANVT